MLKTLKERFVNWWYLLNMFRIVRECCFSCGYTELHYKRHHPDIARGDKLQKEISLRSSPLKVVFSDNGEYGYFSLTKYRQTISIDGVYVYQDGWRIRTDAVEKIIIQEVKKLQRRTKENNKYKGRSRLQHLQSEWEAINKREKDFDILEEKLKGVLTHD